MYLYLDKITFAHLVPAIEIPINKESWGAGIGIDGGAGFKVPFVPHNDDKLSFFGVELFLRPTGGAPSYVSATYGGRLVGAFYFKDWPLTVSLDMAGRSQGPLMNSNHQTFTEAQIGGTLGVFVTEWPFSAGNIHAGFSCNPDMSHCLVMGGFGLSTLGRF